MMKQVQTHSSESDDEDAADEHELLPENPNHSFSSPFHLDVDKLSSSLRRRFTALLSKTNKTYLLMLLIPSLIVLLYFSLDFTSLFRTSRVWDLHALPPSPPSSSSQLDHRIRESQLQSLFLLKQQQLGLSNLLQIANSTHQLKANIFDQISINDQLQKLLFSALDGEFTDLCGKKNTHLSGRRRTIDWIPRSNRYLFAVCVSGQMSNHLMCLEKHMFIAAVLKRVLVIPSHKVDYQYAEVLDIEGINRCLGRKVVVTFDEFRELKRKDTRIDRLLCYFPKCGMDEEHVKKLRYSGVSLPKFESPWTDNVRRPKKRTVGDLEAKFSSDDGVIAVGDVFFADVEREWLMQPGGPIAHQCKTLVEPNRHIVVTAQRFVQTFLGRNYVALHFRRQDFLKFCNAKHTSCFYPVPQAANCIQRVVERAKVPVMYLSTDAAESEIELLRSLIVVDGKPVPLVKRPPRNLAEKWDALLYRHGLHDNLHVEAMLDKAISAMSSVFIGSSGSAFTEDILRLRKDWGSASACDEYICQGGLPDFIADDE